MAKKASKSQVTERINQTFLSEEELLFHRMGTFHQQRVERIASGQSPLGKRDDGFLVVHLLPHSSFTSRQRFDGATLKQHGSKMSAFGDQGGYAVSRFNVDGLLNLDSGQAPESYSQVFRDGRLEAVMSAITFETNGRYAQPDQQPVKQPRYLRDSTCERAVFRLVPEYLTFCEGIGISEPVSLFSALIGCGGVRFYSEWGHRFEQYVIDRTPAYLPDMDVRQTGEEPEQWLRPWCDALAQAMGFDKSPNYDENGNWRERRR